MKFPSPFYLFSCTHSNITLLSSFIGCCCLYLETTIGALTTDLRIGFGSFIDKTVPPFADKFMYEPVIIYGQGWGLVLIIKG